MRLLNARTLRLEEFRRDETPPYAILSHTWGKEEVSFVDIQSEALPRRRAGFLKVEGCCRQALRDGYSYVWIDTCCIDKSSSAELSEAINSMFLWYKRARLCYAYLSDVDFVDGEGDADGGAEDKYSGNGMTLAKSAWFTRGWTLQELLAPETLRFFSRDWRFLGDKSSLAPTISTITGINRSFLSGLSLSAASIAQRMSWAAGRRTTREEDVAYSLLGIFDVHMPLLYGEGGVNAFVRLQEELLRKDNDQSLFAWYHSISQADGGSGALGGGKDPEEAPPTMRRRRGGAGWSVAAMSTGALARSPTDFQHCGDIVRCDFGRSSTRHSILTNAGILIELPLCTVGGVTHALLKCRRRDDFINALAIPLDADGDAWHRRAGGIKIVSQGSWAWRFARRRTVYLAPRARSLSSHTPAFAFSDAFLISTLPAGYRIAEVYPRNAAIHSLMNHVVRAFPAERGPEMETIMVHLENEQGCCRGDKLLLVLTVERSDSNAKKLLGCYLTKSPDGATLSDLWDQLDLSAVGDTISAGGRMLTVTVRPRNLFNSRLFVVDIEQVNRVSRHVWALYRNIRWMLLSVLGTPARVVFIVLAALLHLFNLLPGLDLSSVLYLWSRTLAWASLQMGIGLLLTEAMVRTDLVY